MLDENEKSDSLQSDSTGSDRKEDHVKYVPVDGTEKSTNDSPISDNPPPREPASPVNPDRHKEQ